MLRLRLHLGDTDVQLVPMVDGPDAPPEGRTHRIAPGIEALVHAHLARPGAMAFKIESAITAVEDELARVPAAVHGAAITSNDPQVLAIARVAGLDAAAPVLSREAVEQVFQRLSAVALGRPAASEGLPDTLPFAASVVTLRELMHHLDITALALEPTP